MPKTTAGILLAFLVAGCLGWFTSQPHGFNQLSRIDMLYALAGEGRFAIDTLHANTSDAASYDGHFFSDKPPAVTYLALPAYTLTLGGMRAAGMPALSYRGISVGLWTSTLVTGVLYATLGAVATWLVLLRYCRRPRRALTAAAAFWLGTVALPYGTMLFSHAVTMGLLALACAAVLLPVPNVHKRTIAGTWWDSGMLLGTVSGAGIILWAAVSAAGGAPSEKILVFLIAMLGASAPMVFCAGTWHLLIGQGGGAGERRRRDALVGLAIGTAVLGEYVAAVPAVCLLALSWQRDGAGTAFRRALWAAMPLLLLPLTNWVCFGSPFRMGYALSGFAWMERGFFGVTALPRPDAMLKLLFSPSKGLLFWSPVLALAAPGFAELWRRDRMLCAVMGVSAAGVLLAIASTGNAGGGAAVGARYLAPGIALLALPMALGLEIMPVAGTVLAALSVALNALATAVNPMPPESMPFPLLQQYVPSLLSGKILHTAGSLVGLSPAAALLPIACFAACLFAVLWKTAGSMRLNTDAA